MYVDAMQVVVRALTWTDRGPVEAGDELTAWVPVDELGYEIDLSDAVRDDVQRFVFDRSQEVGGGGYSVTFVEKRTEMGAGGVVADVVVELVDPARNAAWQALAAAVAGYLVERARKSDTDGDD